MDELYYSDSLRWRLPSNLLSVMKPVFEALYAATGKAYVKPNIAVLLHSPVASNGQHKAVGVTGNVSKPFHNKNEATHVVSLTKLTDM